MGQKVNPIGIRLKINRTWDSIWYGEKKNIPKIFMRILKLKISLRKRKRALVYPESVLKDSLIE